MKQGATMQDTKSVAKLKKRYCVLQFHIVTMKDQQEILLLEMEELAHQ